MVGYNIFARFASRSPMTPQSCRWTYLENGIMPITLNTFPLNNNTASALLRPVATGLQVNCGGTNNMILVGDAGHGGIVTRSHVSIMLHRRIPSSQIPTIYNDFRKGDDSSKASTTLYVSFSENGYGMVKKHVAVDRHFLKFFVPSSWTFGSSLTDLPSYTLPASIFQALPGTIDLVHFNVPKPWADDGTIRIEITVRNTGSDVLEAFDISAFSITFEYMYCGGTVQCIGCSALLKLFG